MVGNLALHIAEWYNDDREYGAVAPRLSFVGSYYIHAHTVRLRLAVSARLITRVRDNDIQLGDITVRHELSGGQSLVA